MLQSCKTAKTFTRTILCFQSDRYKVIYELCQNDTVKCENVNYEKFSNLTEGYTIGYLMQFVERAIFYAHKNGKNLTVDKRDDGP